MTIPMRLDSVIPSIFETLADGFKEVSKDIVNSIVMQLIYALQKQNKDLEELLFTLESEPTLATTLDNEVAAIASEIRYEESKIAS